MSDGPPEDVLAKIFRVFDVNRSARSKENGCKLVFSSDGTISEKELKRLVKDMFMMIKEENPEEVRSWLIIYMTFFCNFTSNIFLEF